MNVNVNHAADPKGANNGPKDFNEAYLAKKQRDEDKNNPILKRYRKRRKSATRRGSSKRSRW